VTTAKYNGRKGIMVWKTPCANQRVQKEARTMTTVRRMRAM
jgi:hypothetical protein